MLKTRFLRNILIVSTASAVILPVFLYTFLYPSFTKVITKNAEYESTLLAQHLSSMLIMDGNELESTFPSNFLTEEIERLKKDFRLKKVKIFSPRGKTVYSSNPSELGAVNTKKYFHEIVAKGNTHTNFVKRERRSLEGKKMSADVVETYIPIMRNNKFIGAFEIYYNVAETMTVLDNLISISTAVVIILSLGLLITVLVISMKADKTMLERDKAEKELKEHHDKLDETVKERTKELEIAIKYLDQEIVERRQTERNLRESEDKYRSLISNIPDVTWTSDNQGNTIFISPNVAKVYGYTAEEIYKSGNSLWFGRIHPDDVDRVKQSYQEIFGKERTLDIEYRIRRKDGQWIWLHDRSFGSYSKDGKKYADGVFYDVTERKRLEEIIFQAKQDWENTFDNITDIVTIHDRDFNIIRSNKAARSLLGLPFKDIKRYKCYKLFHGEEHVPENCPSCETVRTGEPCSYEVFEPSLNRHVEIRAMPSFDEKGDLIGVIHVVRDVTERKKIESMLKESEERFRTIVKNSEKALSSLGLNPGQVVGKSALEMYKDYPDVIRGIKEALEGTVNNYLVEVQNISFDAFWSPFRDSQGDILGVIGMAVDVTERKRAADQVNESQKRLAAILDSLDSIVYVADMNTHEILFVNRYTQNIFGDITGQTCWKVLQANQAMPCDFCSNDKLLTPEGEPMGVYSWEFRNTKDRKWYEIRDRAIHWTDGRLVRLEIATDITDRKNADEELLTYREHLEDMVDKRSSELKRANVMLKEEIDVRKHAEQSLIESEKRFRAAAISTADLIWEGDTRVNTLEWYGDIDAILGYPPGEFPRTISGHFEHIHPDDQGWMKQSIGKSLESGEDFSAIYRMRCKDGTYLFWEERGKPIEYEKGVAVKWVGSITDITERKNIEMKLSESEERFRSIYEGSPIGIAIYDSQWRLVDANEACSAIFGILDIEELKKFKLIDSGDFPDEIMEKLLKGETVQYETQFNIEKKKRRVFPHAVKSDILYISVLITPLQFERERLFSGYLVQVQDVTEQRQAEAEVIRAGHLASLGELAAGVAHEINNPINGIINYAQLLTNMSEPGSETGGISSKIIKESDRIAAIVKSLLSFARDRKEQRQPVRISDVLFNTLALTETQIRKDGIKLMFKVHENMSRIIVQQQQIEQVLLNIISNARYALNQKFPETHEHKVLHITGEEITVDDLPYVRISFYDSGTGIPADKIEKVMNPFFSTKPADQGTGLGLSISHSIVTNHGGRLTIDSVEGKFTRIVIDLPAERKTV
jgi:PAS domain S-box-containing protein